MLAESLASRNLLPTMRNALRRLLPALALLLAAPAWGDEAPLKKVLLIGMDGCRTDALLAAKAPHLHTLMRDGAFGKRNDVLGERKTGADTVTMPGFTSMLTGVWADRHGVRDNEAHRPTLVPTFFTRLRTAQPRALTRGFVSFKPIVELTFVEEDGVQFLLDGSRNGFHKADKLAAEAACKVLTNKDLTALFLYFGQVDTAGHVHGFHPKVEQYIQAIEAVDEHVGQVMAALARRPGRAQEDWLIVVATDHGGRGTGHSGGRFHDEVRWTFLILNGPSVEKGPLPGRTANVDVAATALTHLGVPIDPAWQLDGRCIGLKTPRGATR